MILFWGQLTGGGEVSWEACGARETQKSQRQSNPGNITTIIPSGTCKNASRSKDWGHWMESLDLFRFCNMDSPNLRMSYIRSSSVFLRALVSFLIFMMHFPGLAVELRPIRT